MFYIYTKIKSSFCYSFFYIKLPKSPILKISYGDIMENKKTSYGIWAISLIVAILFLALAGNVILANSGANSVSSKNYTINGVSIEGLSRTQAAEKLSQYFNDTAETFSLTLKHNDKEWNIKGSDYKINSDVYTIIDEAQRREFISQDYEKTKEYLSNSKDNNLVVNFNYLFVGLDEDISKIIDEVTIKPTDSMVTFDNNVEGHVIITDEVCGQTVDKEKLYNMINEQYQLSPSVVIDLPMVDVAPTITKEDNMVCTNLVSSFSTSVSDNTGNRKYNVKHALASFDGLRVEPHEKVSFNETTGPQTQANGYKIATIIYDGKFQDGVGGGICQASSTLYNALLLAGRQIDDVQKHTLPVRYVPLSLDAMVSEGISDLAFTNNSDYPMFIHTYSDSENVYVEIYGEQLPEGTFYKTRSEVIRTLPAQDNTVIDYDKKYSNKVLYKGEKYRISYPKEGYETRAYLDKYEDNTLVSSEIIRHDIYKAQDGLVVEGACELPAEFSNEQYQVDVGSE